jgi:signal transduction histidine kinase/DNA-binding response OmpR family regulator
MAADNNLFTGISTTQHLRRRRVLGWKQEVETEQVALLYQQLPSGLAGTVINSIFIAFVQLGYVDNTGIYRWLIVILLVTAGRYGLLLWYRKTADIAADPLLWKRRFAIGVLFGGLSWSLASWYMFPAADYTHQVFLGFVMAGMSAAGMATLSSVPGIYPIFITTLLLPYIVRLLCYSDVLHLSMASVCSAYLIFLWASGQRFGETIAESLRLRFENFDLVKGLRLARERQDAANKKMYAEIRERRRAEKALVIAKDQAESANQAKSLFLANMSHEMRTPMHGILGMSDLLSGSSLSANQQRFVESLKRSGQILLQIIDDILDYSKAEASKLKLNEQTFDLWRLTDELIELLASRAQEKGLELVYGIAGTVPRTVHGDATRVRQVLTNLLGNAIKFTEHGEVVLSVKILDPEASVTDDIAGVPIVEFTVRDSGPGIAPEDQQYLFRPFTQIDESARRQYGGTGLGLAIAKELAELMGGRIEVQSSLGAGSEFRFVLPLRADPAVEASMPQPAAWTGLKVLVVDDNASCGEVLCEQLRRQGALACLCLTANDALQALRDMQSSDQPYDLALIDRDMPDMGGLELSQHIRSDAQFNGVSLVLLAPVILHIGLDQARATGFAAVLHKPISAEALDHCIAALNAPTGSLAPCPQPQPCSPMGGSLRVLLAEDNPVNQQLVLAMLEDSGYWVDIVDNGQDAVSAVEDQDYDLILMDWQMPLMDGVEAAAEIRRMESAEDNGARRIIVALTANALEEHRELCLAAGMDDFLAKPFTKEQLEATLSHCLKEREKDR